MGTIRAVLLLLAACNSKPSASSGAPPPTPPDDPACGTKSWDWCAAPSGDPCGQHKDTDSCKADPRCTGIHYRGESVAPCEYDARGFGTNCPTVGCRSAAK